jgi:hypothetical protein
MAVCGLLLLAGCGTSRILTNDDVFKETAIVRDQYTGSIYVNSPSLGFSSINALQHTFIATSLNNKGDVINAWIDYNESQEGPHALFFMAHDASTLPLKVETLSRQRQTRKDFPEEAVAIYLPTGYLEAHVNGGINIELEGRNAKQVILLGHDFLDGYLRKVQAIQACVKAKTC